MNLLLCVLIPGEYYMLKASFKEYRRYLRLDSDGVPLFEDVNQRRFCDQGIPIHRVAEVYDYLGKELPK